MRGSKGGWHMPVCFICLLKPTVKSLEIQLKRLGESKRGRTSLSAAAQRASRLCDEGQEDPRAGTSPLDAAFCQAGAEQGWTGCPTQPGAAETRQEPGARTSLHLGQAAWTEHPGRAETQAANTRNMLLSTKMLSHSLLFYYFFFTPRNRH